MGQITITNRNLITKAEYVDSQSGLTIEVNYEKNITTDKILSLSGNIYKGENRDYAGNFSGRPVNDEFEYSISGVKSRDTATVIAALSEIETFITGNGNEE